MPMRAEFTMLALQLQTHTENNYIAVQLQVITHSTQNSTNPLETSAGWGVVNLFMVHAFATLAVHFVFSKACLKNVGARASAIRCKQAW